MFAVDRASAPVSGRHWFAPASLGLLILLGAALWSGKWISDDGYIYLSYVRMYDLYGELAFNRGERVDAATGFLWLLLLVAADWLTPFWTAEQACYVLSLSLALGACARVLADRPGHASLATAAALFAPYFVRSFSTSGLETPLILFLLVTLHLTRRHSVRALVCGILPFVRPELFLVTAIYMLPALLRFRLVSLMPCLLTGLVLAATRYAIFGDILPNTTFAKLGLENFGKGWLYLTEFVLSYPEALTVLFLLLLLSFWTIHRSTGSGAEPRDYFRHHASLAAAAALVLVTVRLGGDFMHGRFFLPSFVLLVLGVSEWVRIAHRNAGRSRRRLIAMLATVLPVAGNAGLSYSLRAHQAGAEFSFINDEQLVYSVHNPNQGAWDATNLNRWAHEARTLSDLADLIDGGIGIAQTGVGHIRYFSAESDVYIYDALSLAQHLGTLVDPRGRGGRPGHRAGQPVHFLYANPRITLFPPPDAPLAHLLDFRFQDMDFVLGDLERIPDFVRAGLLPEGAASMVEDRVRAILDAPRTDTQALLYLWYRYRGDPATRARIESLYVRMSEIPYTFPWEHQRNLRFFTAADRITRAEAAAFPARHAIMLREGEAKPLKRRHAYRRHVDRAAPSCEVPVSDWAISGSAASIDAGDPRRLSLRDAGQTVISLPMTTIAAQCPQSVKQVQVLVQPIEVSGQPISRFLASGRPEPIPIYGVGRHGYQPPLVYPLRTSDGTWAKAVTITIPIPEGARAEFEIVAIAS